MEHLPLIVGAAFAICMLGASYQLPPFEDDGWAVATGITGIALIIVLATGGLAGVN